METTSLPAAPKLKTNLDTDFLKLIAILSMLVDHKMCIRDRHQRDHLQPGRHRHPGADRDLRCV